jgi:DNA topoisomerase-3|tara:strand:- start:1038 stop:2006 length:969 start_codon:yes stop_codon:yes gene_type:complete
MLGQLCLRGLRHRVGGLLKAAPGGLYKHALPACLSRSLSQSVLGDDLFGSPSAEDQLQYAQRLAVQAGQQLPEDAAQNPESCSAFIDQMLHLVPASDEQVNLAETLAAEAGESLPDDAIASAAAISAYIARMSPAGAESSEARRVIEDSSFRNPPSDKQLQYAQALALQTEQSLPLDAHEDMQVCSAFIDEARHKIAPSEKQLEFAQKLAEEADQALPDHAIRSMAAISEYIESMLPQSQSKRAKPNAPSQKQLDLVVDLARTQGVGIPAEALQGKHECSQFISSLLQQPKRPMHTSSSDTQTGGMRAQTHAPLNEHEEVPF